MYNDSRRGMYQSATSVTIIVPSYNPGNKLARSVNSLYSVAERLPNLEVIFVDDRSTDGTYEWLESVCASNSRWRLYSTSVNSGTPSVPRNIGIEKANNKYVFFLDCDDELLVNNFIEHVSFAQDNDSDIVRSSLLVDDRSGVNLLNRISGNLDNFNKKDLIGEIISKQSTTNSSLIKKSLLMDHDLSWPTNNHMGEDTIFLISVLTAANKIHYYDKPTIIYHKSVSSVLSTTQKYGRRELESHIDVWSKAEKQLNHYGISYLSLRGSVAIGHAIKTMIRYGTGEFTQEDFTKFSDFVQSNRSKIVELDFSDRIKPVIESLLEKKYEDFKESVKPRLLIAGYDLKFITGAVDGLSDYFNIRIDTWTGHESHDNKSSLTLLEWADVIFCEWMLGNSVWYSQRKRPGQALIIRLHRFETTRNYGHQIKHESVDAYISVSVETLEDMIRTFKLDRSKCRLVPNFLDIEKYDKATDDSRIFKLALVGAIPARKGYLNALHVLRELLISDERYSLTLFGKQLEELPWVANDPIEQAYFKECDQFIHDHQLEKHIQHGGWVNTEEAIKDYGYVLSTSVAESFHVAPAEAFVAENQGLFLRWPGVEFIYPHQYIFDNTHEMVEYILKNSDIASFEKSAALGKQHVLNNYSLKKFIENIKQLTIEI